MVGTLFWNRHRPRFGTAIWFKYWLKRTRLLPTLLAVSLANSRYSRHCKVFGELTVVSPSKIGGDLEKLQIGDHCAIGRIEIQLHADVTIGNCVVINDGCRLLTGTHNVQSPNWELIAKPIVIEDYAWIATGATLLPGVKIGRGAIVGAGAVVAKSVASSAIAVGNPARCIGERSAREFQYQPSASVALVEAWLGPVSSCREEVLH